MQNDQNNTTGRLIFAMFAAFTLAATASLADSYPGRPIPLVIPFPAGGPTDSIARPLAQALTNSLGRPVIVENRAGGAGDAGNARRGACRPGRIYPDAQDREHARRGARALQGPGLRSAY